MPASSIRDLGGRVYGKAAPDVKAIAASHKPECEPMQTGSQHGRLSLNWSQEPHPEIQRRAK